ncbi:MAG: response regulator transcription factor [Ferruginibacter sp.]|nr:response regulator transcription factor [Ferruginibacter sp.]
MKTFLVVDDHVVVRSGIKLLLLEIFKPAEIYEASDGESALKKLLERGYDLIVLDIQMPGTDTLSLMQLIIKKYPDARVLIFSMGAENIYAKRFLKAGARGFISKEAPMKEIVKAVGRLLNNQRYISDALAELLAKNSFESKTENSFNRLSAREFEIATLLLTVQTISHISSALKSRYQPRAPTKQECLRN